MTELRLAQVMAGAEQGGAESFYERLVLALGCAKGVQQRAFTRDYPGRSERLAQVAVSHFRFGGRLHWVDHWRYRRALREFAPQVVLTYMNRATALTPPGNYALVSRLGHYYDLKYYRHADHWIGNTRGICDYLVRGGMPAAQVECIPNFVDEVDADPVPREQLGVSAGGPLLLAAGRLHHNKAFEVLIQALPAVPEAQLCIAGEGPERAALAALASSLGLDSRVRFLGWRDDVAALMRSVDLFVCPSRHEGLGNIVLEAWRNHCAIVATASQGPAELLEHGVTGLLSPVDDSRALAAAINTALTDRGAAAEMAAAGRLRYQRDYSREVIVARYRELLCQLASRYPQ